MATFFTFILTALDFAFNFMLHTVKRGNFGLQGNFGHFQKLALVQNYQQIATDLGEKMGV